MDQLTDSQKIEKLLSYIYNSVDIKTARISSGANKNSVAPLSTNLQKELLIWKLIFFFGILSGYAKMVKNSYLFNVYLEDFLVLVSRNKETKFVAI